ncbi:hypothetical protein M9H77_02970 [Catharanthus roseus]|uniref:Uncharacterized protein n=1 Tax=Catharanthus roseus TaxID=4058 RepID=A0ACC0C9X2_CATRO|nr:hypothetical protein M9H77_02970 [Catharanthus roseus]
MKRDKNGRKRCENDEWSRSMAQMALANKDLPQTAGLALPLAVHFLDSRMEDLISRFRSSTWRLERQDWKMFRISIAASILILSFLFLFLLDYSQGCLELKKEEQSRATNWGLIEAID